MFKQLKIIFSTNWFWAIAVFLISFFVYILTLAPTVSIDDSGELISAAANFGVPHPSGYPLWTTLGHVFSYLPFGAVAWRINLMSAFFSALTVSMVYLLVAEILKNWFITSVISAFLLSSPPRIVVRGKLQRGSRGITKSAGIPAHAGMTNKYFLKSIAFSASLTFAFINLFWNSSVVAEVYSLNVFFVSLIIYLLLLWQEKKENKYLLWSVFLFGLSLTNHQMIALMAPGFLIFVFLVDKKILKNPDLILKSLCFFVLGLALYLYLPLASHFKPAIDWGHPNTWQKFWAHISRAQYSDFASGFNWLSKLRFSGAFVLTLVRELYFVPCVLAVLGIWLSFKKNYKIGWLLFFAFLGNNVLIIFLRNAPYGLTNDYLYEFYYLPSFLIMIIWLAIAAAFLWQKVVFRFLKNILILKILILIFILIWPAYLLVKNYGKNDQSDFWLVNDYTHAMLQNIETNAILVHYGWGSMANDTEIFSLVYALTVEKIRPDIYLLTDLDLWPEEKFTIDKEYLAMSQEERRKKILTFGLAMAKSENRPLYTDFSVISDLLPEKVVSRSLGNVYKIFPSLAEMRQYKIDYFQLPALRNLDDERLRNNLSASDLISRYYYRLATYYLEQNQKYLTNNYLQKAIVYDRDADSRYLKDFMIKRTEWQGK